MSWLGTFEGNGRIGAPWDSTLIALASLAVYRWAVAAGRAHLRSGLGEVDPVTADPATAN